MDFRSGWRCRYIFNLHFHDNLLCLYYSNSTLGGLGQTPFVHLYLSKKLLFGFQPEWNNRGSLLQFYFVLLAPRVSCQLISLVLIMSCESKRQRRNRAIIRTKDCRMNYKCSSGRPVLSLNPFLKPFLSPFRLTQLQVLTFTIYYSVFCCKAMFNPVSSNHNWYIPLFLFRHVKSLP